MRLLASAEWSKLLIETGRGNRPGEGEARKRILILGGGMAGYSVARRLERTLGPSEAEVVLVDVGGNMVYQPFLAEVASGAIEPRHVQVPLRRHLRKTRIVQAKVTGILAGSRRVAVEGPTGRSWEIGFDLLVVALGGVTKTLPVAGIAGTAVGLKTMEEAVFIRNQIISNFAAADDLPKGDPERKRLLTVVVVGGGLTGIEGFAEALSLIRDLVETMRTVTMDEVGLHLVEAADRIMPEIPVGASSWVVGQMEKRGGSIHLGTFVTSAAAGKVETSDGCEYETGLLVWAAGQMANPVLGKSDLPLDGAGRLRCNARLQAETENGRIVEGVFGCGDAARVEDLSGCGLADGSCEPTAQHAVRQARIVAGNLAAVVRGTGPKEYVHANAGCVVDLGRGLGVLASGRKRVVLKGWIAWMAHRVYHSLAMPTLGQRLCIWNDWLVSLVHGRDTASTFESLSPRALFVEHAAGPKEGFPEAE